MALSKPKQTEIYRYHNDPYRWMEEDSPDVRGWVLAQHERTIAQLLSLPARDGIRKRLSELMRAPGMGTVTKVGKQYFFRRRREDQEVAALYCGDTMHGPLQLLFDPNESNLGETTTLADTHPSADGKLIAYRLSVSGSSCMSLYVMDVNTGKLLPDVIPGEVNPVAHAWHTKNQVAWLPDNSGFYYTRCADGTPAAEKRYHQRIYFHRLSGDWRNDELIFGGSLKPEQMPCPVISADGRWLVVLVQDLSGAAPCSELYLLDREKSDRGFIAIAPDSGAFVTVAIHRGRLYIKTNQGAPSGKLMSIRLSGIATGDSALTTVIPEGPFPIRTWTAVADYLFVETIENASSRLRVYDLAGRLLKQIELPGIGSIGALSTEPESNDLLFSFSSFLMPRTTYRMDLKSLTYETVHQDEVPFDPKMFAFEQVWITSRDGTQVPMFLTYRKSLERNGKNPAVVHGYGGFGVSLLPVFAPQVIPFLERGGVYAVLNARGGGEFGEEWHRAGMRANKQNVFDDFIAAGEWLIAERYTAPAKLGCLGWSNGGLSVNAVAVQRPDLWKAVVAGAPVTDMARFHTAHGGRHWIADYGSPEDAADLTLLLQYSPYHTLPEKIDAPAILTIAPGNDDRVASWHSYKMHSAWQDANVSGNPILLRGEEQAGHRGSPAINRTIDRYADIWAFLCWQLEIESEI